MLRNWAENTVEGVVDKLDGYGYDCFFLQKHSTVIRITGCWDPRLEFHKYSLNIPPTQIAADGARYNKPQAALMSALVFTVVPNINTMLLWDLRINVIRLTLAITSSKKKGDEGAALFAVRVHVIVMLFITKCYIFN
jgi:hypothetical protein